jgi:hypothetical protein
MYAGLQCLIFCGDGGGGEVPWIPYEQLNAFKFF